jgi:hypothetical protein
VKALASVDRGLAREVGRALGELGGRPEDPWVGDLARVLAEAAVSSGGEGGAKRRAGGEQAGEDPVLELKSGV